MHANPNQPLDFQGFVHSGDRVTVTLGRIPGINSVYPLTHELNNLFQLGWKPDQVTATHRGWIYSVVPEFTVGVAEVELILTRFALENNIPVTWSFGPERSIG